MENQQDQANLVSKALNDNTIAELDKRFKLVNLSQPEDTTSGERNVEENYEELLNYIKKRGEKEIFKNLSCQKENQESCQKEKQESCPNLKKIKSYRSYYTKLTVDEETLYGKLNLELPSEFGVVERDKIVNHVTNRFDYTYVFITQFLKELGLEIEKIDTIITFADTSIDALEYDKPRSTIKGTVPNPACHMISAKLVPEFLTTTDACKKFKRKKIYEVFNEILRITEFMPKMVQDGIDINLDLATSKLIQGEVCFKKYRDYTLDREPTQGKTVKEKIEVLDREFKSKLELKVDADALKLLDKSQVDMLKNFIIDNIDSYNEKKLELEELKKDLKRKKYQKKHLPEDEKKAAYQEIEVKINKCKNILKELALPLKHRSMMLQLEEYKAAIIKIHERTDSKEFNFFNHFNSIEKKLLQVFYTCYYDAYIKK